MKWYENAVFYHIYPLGLCDCPHENTGETESHFDILNQWATHAKEIGCSAIYIGPLFESGSHGYDTIDYRLVDRRLGSNDDFKQFVSNCHNMGLKVIVDGVFNHTGREFFAFQDLKNGREQSSYKDWFLNVNFDGNNEYNDGFSYENWGGYNLLVKLNLYNQDVKNYHFDTVRFWVNEFDIDGIRLDAADVLEFNFMKELRALANEVKPDFWLMGEVIHGDYSRWANNETLHSVTNYELHKALFSSHNDHNYYEVAHNIKRIQDICHDTLLYTFTDNHDVSRIYSKLTNKEHLYNVALMQYSVPGIPSIYYGSEFSIPGEKGNHDDWNLRPALNLAEYEEAFKDDPVYQLFIRLGNLKKQYEELTFGRYQELYLTNCQFAYGRFLDHSGCITVLNNADEPTHMEINLPFAPSSAVDLLTGPLPGQEDTDDDFNENEDAFLQQKFKLTGVCAKFADIITTMGSMNRSIESIVEACETSVYDNAEYQKQIQSLERQLDTASAIIAEYKPDTVILPIDISSCSEVHIADQRIIIDLPANRGTIIYVK